MSSAPPRRSNRIAAVNTTDKPEAAPAKKRARPASSGVDAEDTREKSPKTKARKRAKTNVAAASSNPPPGRGRGKLRQITETPLDILFEIFSYLEPLDLLHMSRTTKQLRTYLMNKENAFIWRRARLGMGLPPMMEDLSEPRYANLLFDKHCHNCLKTPTKYIQWQARTRLCKNCLEKGTIMATVHQLCYVGVFISKALIAIIPNFRHSNKTDNISWYDVRAFKNLVEESAPFQYGSPQHKAWFLQRQQEHKILSESCKEYENWELSRRESRATEIDSLRRARLDSIVTRLKADGWEEEMELLSTLKTLQDHPLVKQTRQLTDRIWDTIKPALTKIMSDIRADLLEQKYQRAISERSRILAKLSNTFFATLPETPHHPPPSDLCTYQPFLDIIKNTPLTEDATPKLQDALNAETVLALSAEWTEGLTAMLRGETGRNADLSLVVNAFACLKCDMYFPCVLHYPYFASHSCFYSAEAFGDTKVAVWTGKGIKTPDQAAYARCQNFVRMCGLDPDTATAEDMDGADVFFMCEECDSKLRGRKIFDGMMRWRTAMNHHHIGMLARVNRVYDSKLLALGRASERRYLEQDLAGSSERSTQPQAFVCVHCNVAETSTAAFAEHLRTVHGKGPELNVADHYRRSLKNKNTINLEIIVRPQSSSTL